MGGYTHTRGEGRALSVVVVPPGFMSMSGGAYVINVRIAAKKENRKDAVIIRKCEKVKVKKENGKKRYFGFSSLSKKPFCFFPASLCGRVGKWRWRRQINKNRRIGGRKAFNRTCVPIPGF